MAANLALHLLDDALHEGLGDAVAVREPKRYWTYAQLADEAARIGNVLRGLGMQPGQRMGLLLHDSMELAAAFLGALRVGVVPAPMSVLLRPLEVRDLLRQAEVAAVVVHADLAPTIEAVRGEVPSLLHVLAVGGARQHQLDLHALASEAEETCAAHPTDGSDPAFLLFSAGPTPRWHGVRHTHAAVLAAYQQYASGVLALTGDDRVFTTSSLSSAYGLGLGLLFPLLARASTFLLPGRPRPRFVFDVMAAFKPTVFAATPSVYAQLIHDYRALAQPRPRYFEPVRAAVSGGEGLPAAVEQRFTATFGLTLLHGFGTTEALHFVLSNRATARREGSVGRPLEGVEARLVDEHGQPVPAQEIGLLEVRAPTLSPDCAAGGGGWLRLGDRFFADADGYYFYCGRADDLFKVSGRWVAPDEVERTLLTHPAVWECAVVEGHDDDGLARPVAYVVPNVGHEASIELAQDLMGFVKAEIAPYKYPRHVEFLRELPKGADGTVLRWQLRRTAALRT